MADNADQKTQEATPKRKREARERGQVPRSRELSTAAVVGAAVLVMMMSGSHIAASALEFMRGALRIDADLLSEPRRSIMFGAQRLREAMLIMAPVFGATVVAALLAPTLLGGWNFSLRAIKPDFSHINPISGLGRVFSGRGLVELLKSIAKFSLIGVVGTVYLWQHRADLAGLSQQPAEMACAQMIHLVAACLGWMALALAFIAAIDAPYQRWNYFKQLRMTMQEVREEYKQSEGRPEVKARVRRLQHEMARRQMMEKVPTADVVVTNPTHYAVALQYKAGTMRAPVVVAKGADVIAAAIRELAQQHRVPLVSAPPLARALYRGVDLDAEIPVELYAAVAKVLTYIYQLRNWASGARPLPPQIDAVPGGEPDPQ
jgi:flagellar biosynthetic protein FlhB